MTCLLRPLIALLLLVAAPALAQSFPPLSGRVVDAADLLTPEQEEGLTQKLAALETKNARQLVVATVPDLQGYPIEDYGYRLGRSWGIGEKDVNSGALLIVAPREKKVRIEVGYGLEPILTDALSSVIIQSRVLPAFRKGDMGGGIVAGTDGLLEVLSLPDEQAEARAKRIVAEAGKGKKGGEDPVALIFWGIVVAIILLGMMRRGGGGRSFRRGGLPVVLWGPGIGGGWGGGHGGGGFGGGFSGGGGSFGGGGASGGW